jgi:hypothetical protein
MSLVTTTCKTKSAWTVTWLALLPIRHALSLNLSRNSALLIQLHSSFEQMLEQELKRTRPNEWETEEKVEEE